MKMKHLVMVWAAVFVFSVIVFAQCEPLAIEQLTSNDTGDTSIKVSGNNAVWVGKDSNDHKQIYFYNGNTVTKLTDSNGDNTKPQINGKKIVWQGQDSNEGDWEIFFYKGGCIQQVTNNSSDDTNPKLSGTRIFWERQDGNDTEIMSAAIPKEVTMVVVPRVINLKSKVPFINVKLFMDGSVNAIDVNLATLRLLGAVPASKANVSEIMNAIALRFGRPEVQALLTTGNNVEITLTGKLNDGTVFMASDTIKVISPGK
jgi:hypothetical protein